MALYVGALSLFLLNFPTEENKLPWVLNYLIKVKLGPQAL